MHKYYAYPGVSGYAQKLLNDATCWGTLARNMLDHEIAAVQTGVRPPAHAAERPRSTHIARLAAALAGYGFSLRDLAHTTYSRTMDLLAERLLQSRRLPPGHQGPREHYGPAEPAQPWDAQRHAAWAASSWVSK